MQAKLLLIAQIVSGLLTALGYLVSKDALERLDKRLHNWLDSGRKNASPAILSNFGEFGSTFTIGMVLGFAIYGFMVKFPERRWLYPFLAPLWIVPLLWSACIALYLPILWLLILPFISFLLWCPKGVLGGVAFLCFIITTAIKFHLPTL